MFSIITGVVFILLTASAAILAFSIERVLSFSAIKPHLRYRLAFLSGAGLALLAAYLFTRSNWWSETIGGSQLILHSGRVLAVILLAAFGAFLGGLLATGRNEKLWEDNFPPPQSIQAAVLESHQCIIGEPSRDPFGKRAFDFLLSLFGLLVSAPVWLVSLFFVWFEDPGPVLFVKNSVGRGGANFHQYKIRSMVREAERETGPVLAQEGDERVLWIGRLLRKTALDEIPQLFNILRGDMSFVGPRPQRTMLVYEYLQSMPEYAERHCVRPGLAGLAQVAGDYFITPRQKLRFDRLYIRQMSLGFDLKLVYLAFLLTFWYRWQKGGNGRLPRRYLHHPGGRVLP